MGPLPVYVPIVFVLTTLAAAGFLLRMIAAAGFRTQGARVLIVILPLWMALQAYLGTLGFYYKPLALPPRLFVFGVLPALLLIISYFLFFRPGFIDLAPLRALTLLHVIRVPVELVLFWLFVGGQVPQVMTFEGRNFDVASGVLAPIAYILAFRGARTRPWVLIVYNVLGLILLINIVSIAILSLPSPLQRLAFDQPDMAVMDFPYIWLPTIIVPIVLFAHLAALWRLIGSRKQLL